MLQKYLPIVGWLSGYERRWLVADALAGLSVWALLVPQSLAYATIVVYPGTEHYFADHDDQAAALLTQRVLAFLATT